MARSARCARFTIGPTGRCGRSIPRCPPITPPVPEGFDWDLWLGPERERPYHPQLHAHGVPRLVRFRRRLDGRHGALQSVDRVPRAGPVRAHQHRADAQPRSGVDRRHRLGREERFLVPLGQRGALPVSGARPAGRGGPDLVRRRLAAAHAAGTRGRPQGVPRRGHDVRRRQGQDPGRLPGGESAPDSGAPDERLPGRSHGDAHLANRGSCRRACASGRRPARAARNRPAVSCMPAEFRRR